MSATTKCIGEVLLQKGDAEAALAEISRNRTSAGALIGLSMAYHALGQQGRVRCRARTN